MLRGSNIKDNGVGDPVVKGMLGIQRYDIGGHRRRPGRAKGWAFPVDHEKKSPKVGI